jgi:predicted N-acyltransferase
MGTLLGSLKKREAVLNDFDDLLSVFVEEERKQNSDLREEIAQEKIKMRQLKEATWNLDEFIYAFVLCIFCGVSALAC